MSKVNFNEWLDNLVKENDIDILETYIIKKDGKSHYLTIKQIMDCLKLLSEEEKINTKNMLEEVMKEEGSISDCLICLGVGCINTLKENNLEENEETM